MHYKSSNDKHNLWNLMMMKLKLRMNYYQSISFMHKRSSNPIYFLNIVAATVEAEAHEEQPQQCYHRISYFN